MGEKTILVEQSRAPRTLVAPPTPRSESGDQHVRGSTDRELWSPALAWYLCEAPAALGVRGTIAAVIAAVERGGASGSNGYDHHTDQQLAHVERARRLEAQWRLVPERHQRVLIAYYQGESWRPRDDRGELITVIDSRFGLLGPVVAHLWCLRQQRSRETSGRKGREALEKRAAELRAAIAPLADRIGLLEVERRAARRLRSFRRVARAWFQQASVRSELEAGTARLRTLRSELDGVLTELAHATRPGETQTDVLALASACRQGEPQGLRAQAEQAVRRAHKAWQEAGRRETELELAD